LQHRRKPVEKFVYANGWVITLIILFLSVAAADWLLRSDIEDYIEKSNQPEEARNSENVFTLLLTVSAQLILWFLNKFSTEIVPTLINKEQHY
jgi:uncharacterized membrane-anchored protein